MATTDDHDASSNEHSCSLEEKKTPLQDDEIAIVQDNLEAWMVGDKSKKKSIVKNIGDRIHQLAPNKTLKTHQWVTKKKVSFF